MQLSAHGINVISVTPYILYYLTNLIYYTYFTNNLPFLYHNNGIKPKGDFLMKKVVLIILIALICVISVSCMGENYKSKIHQTDVATVQKVNIKKYVTASGRIEYDDAQNVKSPSSAALTNKIYVNVGDKVEKDDIIATITLIDDTTALETFYDMDYSRVNEYISEISKETYNVYAPCSGVISSVNTSENKYLSPESNIVSMNSDNGISVKLNINESKIGDISVGQSVEITGVGFKGVKCNGIVSNIAKEAKQTSSLTGKETTVEVTVNINEANEKILNGFTATCKIITDEEECVAIPYTAIRADNDGKEYVFVVEDGRSKKRYIESGEENSESIKIISGIECGETIVINADNIKENDYIIY